MVGEAAVEAVIINLQELQLLNLTPITNIHIQRRQIRSPIRTATGVQKLKGPLHPCIVIIRHLIILTRGGITPQLSC